VPQSLPLIDSAKIEHAARLLRAGRLVAFPTETVYGLGANALDPEAVARIFAVKGRPATSPLIVHVASIEMAQFLVAAWPATAAGLAQKFWPGPLTLVLPTSRVEPSQSHMQTTALHPTGAGVGTGASPVQAEQTGAPDQPVVGWAGLRSSATIPLIVTAGLPTVGLRMPAHPIALALISAAGVPLAAPSANRFTQLSPTTADHVRRSLADDVDYILDGGPCQVGIESTVLSLAEPQPVLLRPGGISRPRIEAVIGAVATAAGPAAGAHPAPGMHPRHYSPRTSLFLVAQGKLPPRGRGFYLQHRHPPNRTDVSVVQMPHSAAEYTAALYHQLHEADAGNYDWIAVDLPPNTPDWEAVHDRLRRAASSC
jgi:L-threonylcarbamoyladenylate synthase